MARRAATVLVVAMLGVGLTVPSTAGAASDDLAVAATDPTPLQLEDPEPWQHVGDAAPNAYSAVPEHEVTPRRTYAARRSDGPGTRTAAVVAHSAWSWYMDPRVLGTSKATHMSSVRNNGDIQVTSVDRGTSRLRHAVLQPKFQPDDHNAPALTELPDGRIAAFWNSHGSVPGRYQVTTKAGDVTTFGPAQRLTGSGLERDGVTYMTLLQLRGNSHRYHLFTRRARDNAWVMTRSRDLRTWTPAVRLFNHPTRENVPYPKFVTTGWNTIHMAVSDTTASPGQRSSMFHMVLKDGVFRQSNGRVIRNLSAVAGSAGRAPRPIDPREATLVYDGRSADGRARIYDIALDGNVPTFVLTTGNSSTGEWTYKLSLIHI